MPSWTMDRVVPAGHRIRLRIAAYAPKGIVTTVHLGGTSVDLPVVGGTIRLR